MNYRDRRGKRISEIEFRALRRLDAYKRVARDDVGKGSVWTEWDGYEDRLFHTIVFVHDPSACDWLLPRCTYDTEKEARRGHARMVSLLEAIYAETDENGEPSPDNIAARVHAAIDGRPHDDPREVAAAATERRSRWPWLNA